MSRAPVLAGPRHRGARRRIWTAGLAGLLLAVTAACGGDSSDSQGSEDTGAAGPQGVARVAVAVNEAQGMLLDPVVSKSGFHPWMQLMYDTMLYQTPDGIQPGLATEWEFPDPQTVVLTLREGVTFHDGTPFDAEAVKYSWDRVIAAPPEQMQKSGEVKAMTAVEVTGEFEVTVRLNAPFAANWRERFLISAAQLAIVSPTAAEAAGAEFSTNPVNGGAGPYRFVSYTAPNRSVVLEANPDYWNPDAVTLERIEFINTAAGAPTVAALVSGTANIAFATGTDAAQAVDAGLTATDFVRTDYGFGTFFCTNRAPFDNVDARRAIMHAVDREAFVEQAYGGYAVPNDSIIPTSSAFAIEDENPYEYDPDRARELLDKAGVAEGTVVTILGNSTNLNNAGMQVMQQQFEDVGLTLEIIPTPSSFADLKTRNPNLYFQNEGTSYVSQNIFISPGGTANWCNFENPELSAAFAKAADASSTPEEWAANWADYQSVYWDVVPAVQTADISRVTITGDGVTVESEQDPSQGEVPAWAGIRISD